jgi:hypothetical protein
MACEDNCVYCDHQFNLNNLKNEHRRNILAVNSGLDTLNELAIVLNTDRGSLLNTLQSLNNANIDSLFICAKCCNLIKQHASARDKAINLLSAIRARRPQGLGCVWSNLCDKENDQHGQVPPSPMQVVRTPGKSHKKRSRSALTPVKTGLTPAPKRNYVKSNQSNQIRLFSIRHIHVCSCTACG